MFKFVLLRIMLSLGRLNEVQKTGFWF